MKIDFRGAWLDFRFSELEGLVDFAERLLQEEASNLRTRIEQQVSTMSEAQRDEFFAEVNEHCARIEGAFPSLLRRSLFLTIYAEIEAYLNAVCEKAKRAQELELSLHELAGRGIQRAKLYLAKVASVPFPSDSPEWKKLTDYNQLRNALAHTEGRLREEAINGYLGKYVRKHPGLWLDSNGNVDIEPGFCEGVITDAISLFERLPAELLP